MSKVSRLWGWIVSLMEKDKMTGQESAVKRETRRVSFTNQRGGGRTVYVFRREKRIMYILGKSFYRTSDA